MLKTNLWGALLTSALLLVTLSTAWLFLNYLQLAKQLRLLQSQAIAVNRSQALLQGLLTEAVEFSKRDPTLEPLLQAMGVRIRTNAAAAAPTPAAK